MPRNKNKATETILRSTKNKSIRAQDRKRRHVNDHKRRAREITELRNLLKECHIRLDGQMVKITPPRPSRRATTLLNNFAYIANKGVVATQKDNDTFIYPEDYNHFINNDVLNLKTAANLAAMPLPEIPADAPNPPIYNLFTPVEEMRTQQQRKDYHEKEPGRYRRDVNTLKRFFEKNPHFPKSQQIAYNDKEALHRDVTAFNNFSYVVDAQKIATQSQSIMTISSAHFLALKKHAATLEFQDARKHEPIPTQEKQQAHEKNPARKHADFTSAKNMLLQVKPRHLDAHNTINYSASSPGAARTLHQIWTRCAYLAGEDYVTEYSNTTVKMSLDIFSFFFKHFFPEKEHDLKPPASSKTDVKAPKNPRIAISKSTKKKITPQLAATLVKKLEEIEQPLNIVWGQFDLEKLEPICFDFTGLDTQEDFGTLKL